MCAINISYPQDKMALMIIEEPILFHLSQFQRQSAALDAEIIRNNDIKSMTIVRMEVPCCGGLEHAAKTALRNSGKFIPWQVVTISTDGTID